MDPQCRIELLGGFRVIVAGTAITKFRTRPTASLLAYLAYHRTRLHPRELLADLCWPDAPLGNRSLSQSLHSLRHQLERTWGFPPGTILRADGLAIGLNSALVTTDVHEFEQALRSADRATDPREKKRWLSAAIDVYRGDLLPGFYSDWIASEETRLREQQIIALRQLSILLRKDGEVHAAVTQGFRAIDEDPLSEDSYADLIRILVSVGQLQGALTQYRRLERVLREELAAAPSVHLQRMGMELERRLATRPTAPADVADTQGTTTLLLIVHVEEGASRSSEMPPDTLRKVIDGHGGTIRMPGDDYDLLASFARAGDAVSCATDCMLALPPFRWRIALDTRDAPPQQAAEMRACLGGALRLVATARGGQVLCSEATASLVRHDLNGGVGLRELGFLNLREGSAAERVFQIEHPGMPSGASRGEHAGVASPKRLPIALSRFFGREAELNELSQILTAGSSRLLTLVGASGTGKTRLAMEVAGRLAQRFRGGVWFIALGELHQIDSMWERCLEAFGLDSKAGRRSFDEVAQFLSRHPALLILDSFEHRLKDAPSVARLVRRTPQLTCVITSRTPLQLTGEKVVTVLPLPIPPVSRSTQDLMSCPSVAMFVERAQAILPDFRLTSENALTVSALCRQLRGIPLAIELAAARLQVMSPAEVSERLRRTDDVLDDSRPERQDRTLRAALAWSVELLAEPVRRFYASLAAFRGSWSLAAAEAVTGEPLALDHLTELAENSLILMEWRGSEVRFHMLEFMREHARDKLAASGGAGDVRARHLAFFLHLAEQVHEETDESALHRWLEAIETDHENFRAALDWCEESDTHTGEYRRLVGCMTRFWYRKGYLDEGRRRCRQALAKVAGREDSIAAARVIGGAGLLSLSQGDLDEAQRLLEDALAMCRRLGYHVGEGSALGNLASLHRHRGDHPGSQRLLSDALHLYRRIQDCYGEARTLGNMGVGAAELGRWEEARQYHEQALAIWRDLRAPRGSAVALLSLGETWSGLGDPMTARWHYLESLATFRDLRDKVKIALALINLAAVDLERGELASAHREIQECLLLEHELGDLRRICTALDIAALIIAARASQAPAARLLGAAASLRRAMGIVESGQYSVWLDAQVQRMRTEIGPAKFAATWDEGASLTSGAAIEAAIALLALPGPTS